jgi:hypothetical protein
MSEHQRSLEDWQRNDCGLLLRKWKVHLAADMDIGLWAAFEWWELGQDRFWRDVQSLAQQHLASFHSALAEGEVLIVPDDERDVLPATMDKAEEVYTQHGRCLKGKFAKGDAA